MFFFGNGSNIKDRLLDFYISKNRRERLALACVSQASCKTLCTRYISRLVHLKKSDHLTVTSYSNNIPFKMSKDKSYFGVYMSKAD